MEKTCESCRRSEMCKHSGSVCRNWRLKKKETPKVTPEEYAAAHVLSLIHI